MQHRHDLENCCGDKALSSKWGGGGRYAIEKVFWVAVDTNNKGFSEIENA